MGRKLRYVYFVGIWFSLLMLLLFPLPGCVPAAISLASATLETINGNASATPPSGPFANMTSAMQDRVNGDPDISEALAQAEQRTILQECTSKLPPAELSGVLSSCAMRTLCLPGGTAPMRLSVCPHDPGVTPDRRITRSPAWKWDVTEQTGDLR
jgi:hypothetical protein